MLPAGEGKEVQSMKQFNVTGMSCAACSSRVEKAVSKVPGVTSCSVSLLTNSMGVDGTASAQEIIQAVEQAGYGASEKGAANQPAPSMQEVEKQLEDHETPKLKRRLIWSLGFLLVLMYVSMGHMMSGSTPAHSQAKRRPVRPNPVAISSKISNT